MDKETKTVPEPPRVPIKLGTFWTVTICRRPQTKEDKFGRVSLFKNHDQLGRASEFRIADRTGTVAWKDSYGNLFKEKKEVARYPSSWELRKDGVLIWRDSSGYYHYE